MRKPPERGRHCIRCGSEITRVYGVGRTYCLNCGFTFHPESRDEWEERAAAGEFKGTQMTITETTTEQMERACVALERDLREGHSEAMVLAGRWSKSAEFMEWVDVFASEHGFSRKEVAAAISVGVEIGYYLRREQELVVH